MLHKNAWFIRGTTVVLLTLPVLMAGCGKPTATVSGKVAYKGKSLTVGTVRFLTADNKVIAANIDGEGQYSLTRVPPGEVKISVTVPSQLSLTPQQKGINGKADDNASMQAPVPPPKVIKIPDPYTNPETSGLKYTVTTESTQAHNIELK